jgi:uncharacterized protein YbcI
VSVSLNSSNSKLAPNTVEAYRNLVSQFVAKESRTEEEELIVRNFLSLIVDLSIQFSSGIKVFL